MSNTYAPGNPPSAYALEQSVAEFMRLRATLIEDDESFAYDEDAINQLLTDAGGTPPRKLLEQLVDASIMLEQRAEQFDNLRKRYASKRDRYLERAEKVQNTIRSLFEVLRETAVEGELGTAQLKKERVHVVITTDDPKKLAPQYQRVTVEPDKIAIAKALKAKETVEGAEFSNPGMAVKITAF